MIRVVMHCAADKQRNAQVSGIWEFPGSREELLEQWHKGLFPTSHDLVLDCNTMPPLSKSPRDEVAYQGTYIEVSAGGTEQAYWDAKAQADAIMERDGVLILTFVSDKAHFVHPLQAPHPSAKVEIGHLVLKCPERHWLLAFAHGDIPLPGYANQMGQARWIESHLARCQKCLSVASAVSAKMPCPELPRYIFLDGDFYHQLLHCRPTVCRECSKKRPSWYRDPW